MSPALVRLDPLNVKDILGNLSKISQNSLFQDVKVICSDGIVWWNQFLLAANSSWLRSCFSDLDHVQEDVVTILIPEISSSTLSSMLKCTLNHAVRRDTLSVNEQQVMTLLGFSLNLEKSSLVLLDLANAPTNARVIAPLNDSVFEVDSVFNDIPIQGLDLRADIDNISMVSIEGSNIFDKGDPLVGKPPSLGPNPAPLIKNPDAPRTVKVTNNTEVDISIPIPIPSERKTFKCGHCQATFSRSLHLVQHEANHKKEKEMACDKCGKVFYHEMSLKDHMRYHQDLENVFECQTCHKKLKGKRALKNHEDQFHNQEACQHCGKIMPKKSVREHVKMEHQDLTEVDASKKPYQCDICLKSFSLSRSLMLHKRNHDTQRNQKNKDEYLKCDQCGKLFACQEHLDLHLKRKHSEIECNDCGKLVKDLLKHRHNVHTITKSTVKKTRTSKCSDCDQVFASAYACKYHWQKNHSLAPTSEKKKETCSQCGKSYKNLKRHIRESHSENQFECQICGHFFPVQHSLERHVKNVHHPQKLACPYCEIEVLHLSEHLCSSHGMGPAEAREMTSELRGKTASRTDLQFTGWKQGSLPGEEKNMAVDNESGKIPENTDLQT